MANAPGQQEGVLYETAKFGAGRESDFRRLLLVVHEGFQEGGIGGRRVPHAVEGVLKEVRVDMVEQRMCDGGDRQRPLQGGLSPDGEMGACGHSESFRWVRAASDRIKSPKAHKRSLRTDSLAAPYMRWVNAITSWRAWGLARKTSQ